MAEQGFRITDDIFIYQEVSSGSSCSVGLDSNDSDKLKFVTSLTSGATPSGTAQIVIDPAANGDITLTPNGTGVISSNSVLDCTSLSFDSGTNLLSNFVDKSSWTPVLSFGGGSTGITYGTQLGYFSRIGSIVLVHCHIVLTSKGTDVGDMLISGFSGPAPVEDSALSFISSKLTAVEGRVGIIQAAGTIICQTQTQLGGGATIYNDTKFANDTELIITGSYLV